MQLASHHMFLHCHVNIQEEMVHSDTSTHRRPDNVCSNTRYTNASTPSINYKIDKCKYAQPQIEEPASQDLQKHQGPDGGLGGGANSIPGGPSPSHLHAHGIFAPASKSFEFSPLPKNMLRTVWGRAPSKDDSVFFCVLLITCLRRLQALLPNLLLDQSSKSTSCLASPQGVCTSSRLAVHRCRPSNAGLGLLVLPFL